MNFKKVVLILTIASSLSAQANQEEVSTTGVGSADTKIKACEIALDHARREAAQSATTLVQATFTSVESDRGSSYKDDQVVTSKAFAKLLDKSEKAYFDEGTGQIRCAVSARFKAGFVTDNQEDTDSSTQFTETSTQSIGEFKAGEPFCSKIMSRCFREIYSKQLEEFGIQILPSKKDRKVYLSSILDRQHFNMFFNKIAERKDARDGQIYVEITTKESLLSYIKNEYKKIRETCDSCPVILYINSYLWDRQKGFSGGDFSAYYNQSPNSSLFSKPKVSPEYLEALDKEMMEAQVALDGMY